MSVTMPACSNKPMAPMAWIDGLITTASTVAASRCSSATPAVKASMPPITIRSPSPPRASSAPRRYRTPTATPHSTAATATRRPRFGRSPSRAQAAVASGVSAVISAPQASRVYHCPGARRGQRRVRTTIPMSSVHTQARQEHGIEGFSEPLEHRQVDASQRHREEQQRVRTDRARCKRLRGACGAQSVVIVMPPSTTRLMPVTNDPARLERYSTA